PAPAPSEAGNYYRMMSPHAEKYLSSYVRHVAHVVGKEQYPDAKVKRVQVYRLAHIIIPPDQLAAGVDPLDPSFYTAWFLGVFKPNGEQVPDPFTNWVLPIQ